MGQSDWISIIGTVVTIISFVVAIRWNNSSNKKARKQEFEYLRQFALAMNTLRQIEEDRINMQIKWFQREAESLRFKHDMVLNRKDIDPSEKQKLDIEYNQAAVELVNKISDLKLMASNNDVEAVKTVTEFLNKSLSSNK